MARYKLPWSTEKVTSDGPCDIYGADDWEVDVSEDATAAMIVRRVNGWQKLNAKVRAQAKRIKELEAALTLSSEQS